MILLMSSRPSRGRSAFAQAFGRGLRPFSLLNLSLPQSTFAVTRRRGQTEGQTEGRTGGQTEGLTLSLTLGLTLGLTPGLTL